MNRIPVFGTIAHAYGFAISQFLRLLGITWAPLAVMTAVSLLLTPGFPLNHMPVNDPEEVARQTLQLAPGIFLLTLFVRAMIGVGVTELALGKRSGTTFVYFSLGSAVWRLLAAWLLFILLTIVIYIALIILVVIVALAGGFAIKSAALSQGSNLIAVGLLASACAVLFIGALVYVMARLTFLIPPVVVNEQKVDLARGWELTRGNFWRIFIIALVLFIPLIAVGCAVFVAVYGMDLIHTMTSVFVLAMQGAKETVIQQRVDMLSEGMRAKALILWPYTAVANLLLETFAFGLMYGASAFAYRAVTPAASSDLR